MGLDSFRKLLLKKSVDSITLQKVFNTLSDELLLDYVVYAIEKSDLIKNANAGNKSIHHVIKLGEAINHEAQADEDGNKTAPMTTDMIRDALSHHISHYHSALKNNNRAVADQHVEQIVPLLHLGNQLTKHSGGNFKIDAPNLRGWERNYTTSLTRGQAQALGLTDGFRGNPLDLWEETKGADRRPAKKASRHDNIKAVPDYRYLEMPKHPDHPNNSTGDFRDKGHERHTGGYPFEEIQIGDPISVKKGQAHLHINYDLPAQDKYVPHPFDEHPALGLVAKKTTNAALAGKEDDIVSSLNNWDTSKAKNDWVDQYQGSTIGGEKPRHFWQDLELQPQPHHVHNLEEAAKAHLDRKAMPANMHQIHDKLIAAKLQDYEKAAKNLRESRSLPVEDKQEAKKIAPIRESALPPELAAKFAQPKAEPQPTKAAPPIDLSALPPELAAKFGKK
jgi:hypothetical protein